MGLGDFVRKQFVDVIEWTEPADGILSFRFPMRDREIQNGAMLTVRESQAAAFVNEGRIADVFGPGVHRLTTRNLPLLTDLMNWDKLFESPFKSDVYFFSTRLQVDQRWGTATPVTVRDAEFGAIPLRAYGIYTYRIADPRVFHSNVSGTREADPDRKISTGSCGRRSLASCRKRLRRATSRSSTWRRTRPRLAPPSPGVFASSSRRSVLRLIRSSSRTCRCRMSSRNA